MTVDESQEIEKEITLRLPAVEKPAREPDQAQVEGAPPSPAEPEAAPGPEVPAPGATLTEAQPRDAWVVEDTPTPPYVAQVTVPARPALGRAVRLSMVAALIFSVLALALSAALVWGLLRVGAGASALLDNTLRTLESVCGSQAEPFTFTFSQTVRFKGEVALPEGLVFPFKGNIPINTVVPIELPAFLNAPPLQVPINMTVPIDTKVPVPGGIKIPIDTAIPVRQEIPIDLCGDASPLAEFLEQTIRELRSLRDLMRFP